MPNLIRSQFLVFRGILFCAFLMWALVGSANLDSLSAQSDTPPSLFGPSGPPGDVIPPVNELILNEKNVIVAAEVLSAESFTVSLFEGRTVTAERRSIQRSGDNILWRGQLADVPGSSVTLILRDGAVTGVIYMYGESYTLVPAGNDQHTFRQVAQKRYGLQDDSVEVEVDDRVVAAGLESLLAPAGDPVVDVMVVWSTQSGIELAANTGSVGSAPGTTVNPATVFTDMEEWINFAIQIANEAYLNSMSDVRLRLVHTQEVAYSELNGAGAYKDYNTYLNELEAGGDGTGPLSVVQGLEQLYKADLVALLVHDPVSSFAGLAWRPSENSQFNLGANTSVTGWDAIFPGFAFTHELGHNFGLQHDPANVTSAVTFVPYAFGHQDPSKYYRTIMSYICPNPLPTFPSPRCQTTNYLSNPNKNFPAPSGNPMGTSTANNASAIDDSAPLVSAYRSEVYDIAIGDTLRMNGIVFGEWADGTANEACVDDQDGNNDVGGIDDATHHCVATNQVDQFYFLQSIDDTTVASSDPTVVCTLVDTTPDQKIDHAVCTTVDANGSGASQASKVELYTCDNTSTTACAGASPMPVKTYDAARPLSGGHYSNGVYHFGNDENGPFSNNDSQLEIQVPYADMGVSNGDNVCTKLATFGSTSSLAAPLDSVLQTANYLEYDTNDGTGSVGQCTTTLAIEKTVSASSVPVNGSADYVIKVTNTGNVAADAVLTDLFPTDVTVGSCTAKLTTFSYSSTETNLGTFPIEQDNCTDADGANPAVQFAVNPSIGAVTSPLTCVFDAATNARISTVNTRATVIALANATFEMNQIRIISPAGTQSTQATGNNGYNDTVAHYSIPEVYLNTGDPTFSSENAFGQWQVQFFDRGFNNPSVNLRLVPGSGETEMTLFGFEQVATDTTLTPGNLTTGASHTLPPGAILEYTCPVTVPDTICTANPPTTTQVDNTATVTAMQGSSTSWSDSASFNVPTADTCPTPVRLIYFTVDSQDDTVTLAWQTGTEVNSAGFHLYRSPASESSQVSSAAERTWTRINDKLIAAKGSAYEAAEYVYTAPAPKGDFEYMLEAVDTNGTSIRHAPTNLASTSAEQQHLMDLQHFLPLLFK